MMPKSETSTPSRANARAILAAPPMLSWKVTSLSSGTSISGCLPLGTPSMALSRIMSPTTATWRRRCRNRSAKSLTGFCSSCGLDITRPWRAEGGRFCSTTALIMSGSSIKGKRSKSADNEDHVDFPRAMDAGHQPQLDVAGLARPRNENKRRWQAFRRFAPIELGEQVEQVRKQLRALGDRDVNGRQQTNRARLARLGQHCDGAGFRDQVIDAGDADVRREKGLMGGVGCQCAGLLHVNVGGP